jgi:hypothetical protein
MPDQETPPTIRPDLVRVKLSEDELTFDAIKTAIYAQAHYLFENAQPSGRTIGPLRVLLLSRDIYEILNRRLVFSTSAHKELPHFITPYGNLRVEEMQDDLDEPLSFIIE